MAKANSDVCPECGARLRPGAEVCDLCGLPLQEAAAAPPEGDEATEGRAPSAAAPRKPGGILCNQCGWQNPAGARFCSQCGARLQARGGGAAPSARAGAGAPSSGPAEHPAAGHRAATQGVNRRVAVLVGSGVLLVVALYLLTVFSKAGRSVDGVVSPTAPPPQERIAAQPAPLPAGLAEQVARLEGEVAQLEGPARLQKQRELVNLLVGAGRFDQAAREQQRVAEAEGTAAAWKRAGDLYYDWMDVAQGEPRTDAAKGAIAAYQRVLEAEPDNLDVRTDMAVAYLYDPDNPMEAIRQTNLVLEKDPDHVQANFNRGIMLMQINRLDQALAQFERVKQLVGESSPVYQQAEAVSRTIRELQAGQGGP